MTTSSCRLRRLFFCAPIFALVGAVAVSAAAQVVIEETTPTHPRAHRARAKKPGVTPTPASGVPSPAATTSVGRSAQSARPTTRKPVVAKPPTVKTAKTGPVPGGNGFVAPRLLWRTLLQHCDSAPATEGEPIFVTAGNAVYALDAGGHTLRMTEVGATEATPLLDTNRVYFGTSRGVVYALDKANGRGLWKFTGATDAVLTSPAVGAGRLYVESSDNNVYGLAARTGGQIWKFTRLDGSLGYASPVYAPPGALTLAVNSATGQPSFAGGGGDALFACGDNTVYRLDPSNGHALWHTPVGGKSLSTPALGAGRLYVGGDGPGLTALAATDGHQVWAFAGKGEREWFGAPTFADGAVYVATTARYVYALDAATGKPRWSARLLTGGIAAPILDARRNVLYVATRTGVENPTLTALDARTGAKLWDAKIGALNAAPTIVGDRLYVGSTDGNLYCYALK